MQPLDIFMEMYLAPESTGVYDWTSVVRSTTPGSTYSIMRQNNIIVTRGSDNLNDEPTPGPCRFSFRDPDGTFNDENPMSIYYGSFGRGTRTRTGVLRVDDQFERTETNTWGSVGNTAGDAWTNGTSTGGTVSATDWTVSGGMARHSIPVDGAYRVSELSKTTRTFIDSEVHLKVESPVTSITGTGAIASEVWFRTVDVNNFIGVSLLFEVTEDVYIAVYERLSGTVRYLLNYTHVDGLNLGTTGAEYDLRCQIEGESVRVKVWETGTPEPLEWQCRANGAPISEGYTSVATYVFSGNTNTKPLVMRYPSFQARLVAYTGEVADITPEGDDKTEAKVTHIVLSDVLDRLLTPGSGAEQSVMRRGRANPSRWFYLGGFDTTGGSVRTFTAVNADADHLVVGDFFILNNSSDIQKYDTIFTITSIAVGGSTTVTFSPDAYDAIVSGEKIRPYRTSSPESMPVEYWPCEDKDSATQVSSGVIGGLPMSIVGSVDFAADSGFPCSDSLLKVNDAELVGSIRDYNDVNQAFTITFLLRMPESDEAATGSGIIQFYTSGTGYAWDFLYTATGNGCLQLLVYNTSGTLLYDSGQVDFNLRGTPCQISLYLQQVGGTVTYGLFATGLDGSNGGVSPTVVTGVTTLGKCLLVRVNPLGGYDNMTIGHLTVVPDVWDVLVTLRDVVAWSNRTTFEAFERLSHEIGALTTARTDRDVLSARTGAQLVTNTIDRLKEVVRADGGFLYNPRGDLSLELCTRGALTNQSPIVSISSADDHIMPPFRPKRDFANVRNKVIVNRVDGTTATVEMTDGPLSNQAPPTGIGERERAFTLSIGSDTQALDQANYRLGLGTVVRPRVAKLRLTAAAADSITVEQLMSLDIGRRVDITDLSSMDIYDDLPQLILGYTLSFGDRFFPELEINATPYEPFQVLALTGDRYSFVDGADTVTGSTLTTTQTGNLTLTSSSGNYPWTEDSADFPQDIMISGERITISGVASGVATITARSVNGVVKSHATGESVTVATPNYWAFR